MKKTMIGEIEERIDSVWRLKKISEQPMNQRPFLRDLMNLMNKELGFMNIKKKMKLELGLDWI